MSDGPYIWLVALDADKRRRCYRSETDPGVVTIARQQIDEALSGMDVEVYPGHTIKATTAGGALLVTVLAASGAPLCTISVGRTSRQSDRLWQVIGAAGEAPPPPWCATQIYAPLAANPDAIAWLGDYQRCVAWAWMERP